VIVQEEDLGNYTCHAVNKLGWAEGTIMVSGVFPQLQFTSEIFNNVLHKECGKATYRLHRITLKIRFWGEFDQCPETKRYP
jgi:hypothetical protein